MKEVNFRTPADTAAMRKPLMLRAVAITVAIWPQVNSGFVAILAIHASILFL
jgi:hypothetical protein